MQKLALVGIGNCQVKMKALLDHHSPDFILIGLVVRLIRNHRRQSRDPAMDSMFTDSAVKIAAFPFDLDIRHTFQNLVDSSNHIR